MDNRKATYGAGCGDLRSACDAVPTEALGIGQTLLRMGILSSRNLKEM